MNDLTIKCVLISFGISFC